jgi:hypothetical protein
MNQPDKLPAELIDPDLSGNDRALPEFEPLLPILYATIRARWHRPSGWRRRRV